MKKQMLRLLISTFILMNVTLVQADPLKLPTRNTIVKLIKKALTDNNVPTSMVGVESGVVFDTVYCQQPRIDNVSILKIGRAQSNYYERSGSYIDSAFVVKFKAKGSCKLSEPAKVNHIVIRKVKGRLPFRNIPFKVTIATDDFGDWVASNIHPFNYRKDDPDSESSIKYLNNIYYLQNKDKIDAENQAEQAKANKQKKDHMEMVAINKSRTKKEQGIKARLATIKKQMSTQEDFRNYQQLANSCKSTQWQYCLGGPLSISNFEKVYIPLVLAQKKYNGKIVKKLNMSNGEQRSRADYKRFQVILDRLFKPYPDIERAYKGLSQPQYYSYRDLFFNALYYQKTDEARRLVLVELGKKLLGRNSTPVSAASPALSIKSKNNQRSSSKPSSSRHSHSGRFHSHKLPRQGKAHRHGNGAIGR